uniref:JAB domain-containing protein n=1 Tax=Fervidobacterium thailandense TaxID=1008305 RepID=A0A7C5RIX5_9BACT
MSLKNGPRERLLNDGPENLTNHELIAILLRTGTKSKDVLTLSKELYDTFGSSLYTLSRATLHELKNFPGLGDVKAITLIAAMELAKRLVKEETLREEGICNSPEKVFRLCIDMQSFHQEVARVLFLDSKLRYISSKDISRGTLNASIVHPRDVFREAILRNSAAIVLVHNHPSGDPNPSPEDVEITFRIKKAGEMLGIQLLDHVIVGKTFFSFRRDYREVRWDDVGQRER